MRSSKNLAIYFVTLLSFLCCFCTMRAFNFHKKEIARFTCKFLKERVPLKLFKELITYKVSSDNRVLAVMLPDGKLQLFDVPTRQLKREIRDVHTHAFSPDGRFLAVHVSDKKYTGFGILQLYQTATMEKLFERKNVFIFKNPCNRCWRFSPGSTYIAVTTPTESGANLQLYDTATGVERFEEQIKDLTNMRSFDISPDDTHIAVRFLDSYQLCKIYDISVGKPICKKELKTVYRCKFSPCGKFFAAAGRESFNCGGHCGWLQLFDVSSWSELLPNKIKNIEVFVCFYLFDYKLCTFSPRGNYMTVKFENSDEQIYKTSKTSDKTSDWRRVVFDKKDFAKGAGIADIIFSSDETYMAIVYKRPDCVQVYDMTSEEPKPIFCDWLTNVKRGVKSCEFISDKNYLGVLFKSDCFILFDIEKIKKMNITTGTAKEKFLRQRKEGALLRLDNVVDCQCIENSNYFHLLQYDYDKGIYCIKQFICRTEDERDYIKSLDKARKLRKKSDLVVRTHW